MKDYKEMTREEINAIIRKGGNDLKKLNQVIVDYLDGLDLSKEAFSIIANTDINSMAEAFGGLFTVEEVEKYVIECYVVDDVLDLYIDMVGEAAEDRSQELEKNIDCVVNDIVCSKYTEYNREQQEFIIEEVKNKYNEL